VELPEGKKTLHSPLLSQCVRQTNFAMLIPPEHFKGWKITTVGDDIAWMQVS